MSSLKTIMGSSGKILLGMGLALIFVLLVQNWEALNSPLTLKLLASKQSPLGIWFLVMALLGFVAGLLLTLRSQLTLRKQLSDLETRYKEAKEELDVHRNASLKEDNLL